MYFSTSEHEKTVSSFGSKLGTSKEFFSLRTGTSIEFFGSV
jgi:hypothetical protein